MQHCPSANDKDLLRVSHGEYRGYVVVRGGEHLLIDCPVDALAVTPSTVLHTHIQEEHCREWAACPGAPVHVPHDCTDIAARAPTFQANCRTQWPYDREWEYRGRERYGHTGCVTVRPPAQPLHVVAELTPGETFRWHDVELEVLDLRGHDDRAVGLYWRERGILFSGDLLRAGGFLVNVYDTERDYGTGAGLDELRASLERALALQPEMLLPATGEPITEPQEDIESLIAGLTSIREEAPVRRADEAEAIINCPVIREFSRYREILPGLYQNNNFGAMTLFVDAAGRGLLVDPDFCVWTDFAEACDEFRSDLDRLERETGLQRVERVYITHPHGDHVEYAHILKERYDSEICAVHDAAQILAQPDTFRYPGLLTWFGLWFDRIAVDRDLAYGRIDDWHGVPVTPVWTPGHCNAHAGYLVEWQGKRIVCTGDFFQYGAGPIRPGVPICYNDNAWPDRGPQYALRRLLELRPDYLLSGHSHCCHDPRQEVLRDFRAVYDEAFERFRDLVHDGDLMRAMTPPGYDELRQRLRPIEPGAAGV